MAETNILAVEAFALLFPFSANRLKASGGVSKSDIAVAGAGLALMAISEERPF